jgi:hypothetical protein
MTQVRVVAHTHLVEMYCNVLLTWVVLSFSKSIECRQRSDPILVYFARRPVNITRILRAHGIGTAFLGRSHFHYGRWKISGESAEAQDRRLQPIDGFIDNKRLHSSSSSVRVFPFAVFLLYLILKTNSGRYRSQLCCSPPSKRL